MSESNPHEWMNGLTTRARNILWERELESKEAVLEAIRSGKLHPDLGWKPRNYGWGTHCELALWLGLPEPLRPRQLQKTPHYCPHCGGKL